MDDDYWKFLILVEKQEPHDYVPSKKSTFFSTSIVYRLCIEDESNFCKGSFKDTYRLGDEYAKEDFKEDEIDKLLLDQRFMHDAFHWQQIGFLMHDFFR